MSFKDHFSRQSAEYSRYRPEYPPRLIEYVAKQAPRRRVAVDCATGNGQAAGPEGSDGHGRGKPGEHQKGRGGHGRDGASRPVPVFAAATRVGDLDVNVNAIATVNATKAE